MNRARKIVAAVLLAALAIAEHVSGAEADQPAPHLQLQPSPHLQPQPSPLLQQQVSSDLQQLSLTQLEQQLFEINRELERLSQHSLHTAVGPIGFRSQTHNNGANQEWIQIDLGNEYSLDLIVLVPTIWQDTVRGFRADAFPLEFRIVAGLGTDVEGTVIASFDAHDDLLPRVAPLSVLCHGITASWVRVEADVLSPRQFDGNHLLQLAEILVFSGPQNVALRQPLQTSSDEPQGSPAWGANFLVDGVLPYLMNSAEGDQSLAFVSMVGIGERPSLAIDLETTQPISEIRLHLVDQSDTVPQSFAGDFGIPRLLRIEGANQQDFSDATVLDEILHETIYDVGPIIMRRFPETNCRYVRLTAIDPYIYAFQEYDGSRIGFAEIELIGQGRNVALGKQFQALFKSDSPERTLAALTDGHNHYGRILSPRAWIAELIRRHELEARRPLVAAELNQRYLQQKANINHLLWLAGLLALAAVCAVLIGRIIRQRAVYKVRERIAADLHDEIGANIHAIGLLGDLAQAAADAPDKLKPLLARMRELTERAGTAAGYCAKNLESAGLYDDLEQEMRRSSARIMADLEHDISFEGQEMLGRLEPRKRIDLFLFYKECLINILRHSGATRVTTRLKADRNELRLTVTDNGCGLSDSPAGNSVPPSLRRRARLLGGQVSATHPEGGGTSVVLRLRLRKLGLIPLGGKT